MQKLKRDRGDTFNSILPNLLCIVVTLVFVILFTSWIANVTHRQDLNSICRKYILQMEATGYLTDEMRANLEAELVSAGMTNIAVESPTTLAQVEYGEDVYLKVSGKLPVFQFGVRGLTVDDAGNVVESTNTFLEIIAGTSSWDVSIQKSSISKAPYGTTPDVEYIQILASVVGNSGGAIYYNNSPTRGIRLDKGDGGKRFTFKASAGYVIDTVYVNSVEVPLDSNGNAYNGQTESAYTFGLNLQESQTLVIRFRPMTNITYKVYHYQQNIDGVTYSLTETDTLLGTTNEMVTCATKTYEGFVSPTERTLKVLADGSAYIEYRYDREQYRFEIDDTDKYFEYVDVSGSSTNGSYMYGATITLNEKISYTPSEMFILSGWTGDITTTNNSHTFTMPANNVTVKPAISIKTYTLTFDNNGGTGSISSIRNLTYFDRITLPSEGFSKSGFEFLGWSTNKNAITPDYIAGQTDVYGLTTGTAVTLYAVWGDLGATTYTVNHYVMDATGTYKLESTEVKDGFASSVGYTAISDLINSNYVQENQLSFDHAEIDKTTVSSFTPALNGATTVNMYYARTQYSIIATTTSHAYINGTQSYRVNAYYGQAINIPVNFDNGYELGSAQVTSANVSNFKAENSRLTFTMPASDVALYVTHKCIKYTISYDLDGGTLLIDNPISYDVETATFTLNNPVKEHYTFIGWVGTGISSAQLTVNIAQGTTGDISLTAVWLIDSYTLKISYPGEYGSVYVNSVLIDFSGTQPYETKVDYGQALEVKFAPDAYDSIEYLTLSVDGAPPERLTEDNDQEYVYSTDCMEHNLEFDLEFFASTYTVRFDSNNGTGETKDQIMTFNESETLDPNTFTKKGYVFKGWSMFAVAVENGQSYISYQDKQEVINLASSNGTIVTLYAVWIDEEDPTAVLSTTNNFDFSQQLTCTPVDTGSGIRDIYFADEPGLILDEETIYGTSTQKWVEKESTIYVYVRDHAGNVTMYGPVTYYKSTFITPEGCTVEDKFGDFGTNYVLTANGADLDPMEYSIIAPSAEKEDCTFVGWNEDPNATTGVMTIGPVTKSATYYPIFIPKNSTLVNGVSFNTALKQLVNTGANYTVEDNTITSIQYTTTKPVDGTLTVNVAQSGHDVLAYRDGGTVYLYSEAETIFYNPDSSYMFYNFKALGSLDITQNLKFKTTKTTNMAWMFENCGYDNLTSLNLAAFDTELVTNMEGMFANCGHEKMTSLSLGYNFKTLNVTNMKAMFTNCGYNALTSLSLGDNFNTAKVTDMKAMFAYVGYNNLTSLSLGNNFDVSKVKDTSYMFAYTGYAKMTTLTLGSKFTCDSVTNADWMFLYCGNTSMSSLNMSAVGIFDSTTLPSCEYIFANCGKKNACTITLKNEESVAAVQAMNADYLANVNSALIKY